MSWAVLTLADAVDEYFFNTDTCLGAIVFFGMPITMFIAYVIHCLRKHPAAKELVFWFCGFYAVFLPLWLIVYYTVNENSFIVYQYDRSEWLNLNGIEYILYGFSALGGFSVLCLLFHIICLMIRHYKKKHNT